MPASLDHKLVVAVASSALFDLAEADNVFREQGADAYRRYQRQHERTPLSRGVAFPLIRRLLALRHRSASEELPVEVVLLSRNDPDSGLRILRSIAEHGLAMSRALFVSGRSPFRYAQAVGASLFLSANLEDVRAALAAGIPAGRVGCKGGLDDVDDAELRIAFDFDGVLADDQSESVYQADGLDAFHRVERERSEEPLRAGPLARFCRELSQLQRRTAEGTGSPGAVPSIRTAIVTSRGAPAEVRVVTTLRSWGIHVDDAFFLGGLSKAPVIAAWRPHIFFDDQLCHLEGLAHAAPWAHVPFGVANGEYSSLAPPVSWLH